jgi:hypothetical protein
MTAARTGKAAVLIAAAILGFTACGGSSGDDNSGTTNPTPTSAPTTPAPVAGGQHMKITPNKGLHTGQTVTIVGTGYTAGKTYGMTECANKGAATGAGDCDLRHISISPKADASGKVTATFVVYQKFGSNHIDCTQKPGCLVSLATAGVASPDEVAAVPIKFA